MPWWLKMSKKKEDDKFLQFEDEELEQHDKKATNTAFIIMFPALILAGMAGLFVPTLYGKLLVIALAAYQFLMLKKFIQDYYKK